MTEAVLAAVARARELQSRFRAFAEITEEVARADAERAQGPLCGMPVGIKDVIDVAGVPTRLGTSGAGHRVPTADAVVVARLRAGGAVVIGKTTTHELAIGMITPDARNPRNPGRITGGSSGGSAAAVAAGIVPLAIGSDTNGSIRAPAAHCGIVGFKPTYGVVPTTGVAPLARSQDTVGLMAAGVGTVREAWATLAGAPESAEVPDRNGVPGPAAAGGPASAMRIGFARRATAAASPAVAHAVERAAAALVDSGAVVVDVEIPDLELVRSASILVILRESAQAWAATVGEPGLSPEVRGALRASAAVSEASHRDAKRVRGIVCAHLARLYAEHRLDALLMPTVPITATPVGSDRVELNGRRRSVEALQSEYTALASLTGQPAISLPCGDDPDGLPIGLQLLGRAHADERLLEVAELTGRTVA